MMEHSSVNNNENSPAKDGHEPGARLLSCESVEDGLSQDLILLDTEGGEKVKEFDMLSINDVHLKEVSEMIGTNLSSVSIKLIPSLFFCFPRTNLSIFIFHFCYDCLFPFSVTTHIIIRYI